MGKLPLFCGNGERVIPVYVQRLALSPILHLKRPPRPPPPKELYQRLSGAANKIQITHFQRTVLVWNLNLPSNVTVISCWRPVLAWATPTQINTGCAKTCPQNQTTAWNSRYTLTNSRRYTRTSGQSSRGFHIPGSSSPRPTSSTIRSSPMSRPTHLKTPNTIALLCQY